jgi:hypothetical protein
MIQAFAEFGQVVDVRHSPAHVLLSLNDKGRIFSFLPPLISAVSFQPYLPMNSRSLCVIARPGARVVLVL